MLRTPAEVHSRVQRNKLAPQLAPLATTIATYHTYLPYLLTIGLWGYGASGLCACGYGCGALQRVLDVVVNRYFQFPWAIQLLTGEESSHPRMGEGLLYSDPEKRRRRRGGWGGTRGCD